MVRRSTPGRQGLTRGAPGQGRLSALFSNVVSTWALTALVSPAAAQTPAATSFAMNSGTHLALVYISDTVGVVSGGLSEGTTYNGRLGVLLDVDLEAVAGWRGATAHASIHQIHGRQPTEDHVGALMAGSNVEAEPATRLFNLWIEQRVGDSATLRLGSFTAGQEFFISPTAALFVNATFGWPAILSDNLPSGGPAYPLSTPGVRLSYRPNSATTVLFAAFNGDPAGPGDSDPQRRDRAGFNGLRISGPPFLMAEAQFAHGPAPNAPDRIVRIGAWTNRRATASPRFDAEGLSLADPQSSGAPARLSSQWGAYAIVDQVLFKQGDQVANGFVRVAATQSDRTLISAYVDLGVTLVGLAPKRPKDTVGLAVAYAGISRAVRGLHADANRISAAPGPVGDYELAVELTYQAVVTSQWSLQPNLQYIVHPGGGATSGSRVSNALVVGLRSSARF